MASYIVYVQTRTKANKIARPPDVSFRVWVKASPRNGHANAAVVKILAHYLAIPPSLLSVKSGYKARTKIVTTDLA